MSNAHDSLSELPREYTAHLIINGVSLTVRCKPKTEDKDIYYEVVCDQRPNMRLRLKTAHNFESKALEVLAKDIIS